MAERAVVMDVRDPRGLGRIKVVIPSRSGKSVTDWIWPIAGKHPSLLPGPGTQVFVVFEASDPDYPVWLPNLDTLAGQVESLQARVQSLEAQAHNHV